MKSLSVHTYIDISSVSHPSSKLLSCKAAHLELIRVTSLGLPFGREINEGWSRIHVQLHVENPQKTQHHQSSTKQHVPPVHLHVQQPPSPLESTSIQ